MPSGNPGSRTLVAVETTVANASKAGSRTAGAGTRSQGRLHCVMVRRVIQHDQADASARLRYPTRSCLRRPPQ